MNDTVQFYLSRAAADAVDVDRLKFRARGCGLADATAETSYYRTGGRCRVTCRRAVAQVLVADLHDAIAKATTQAVVDECQRALCEIDEAFRVAELPVHGATSDAARGLL